MSKISELNLNASVSKKEIVIIDGLEITNKKIILQNVFCKIEIKSIYNKSEYNSDAYKYIKILTCRYNEIIEKEIFDNGFVIFTVENKNYIATFKNKDDIYLYLEIKNGM
ncbi:MAG: hypothetical protein RR662_03835 [Clostridia bacterium]